MYKGRWIEQTDLFSATDFYILRTSGLPLLRKTRFEAAIYINFHSALGKIVKHGQNGAYLGLLTTRLRTLWGLELQPTASGKAPILAVFKILVAHLLPAGRRTPQHVGSDPYKLKNRYYAFTKRNYFRFMIPL